MHTTTKGALAAGAAAVLLLGGTGSLAYWSGSASVDAGSFTSGRLALTAGSCDANWTYATGAGAGTAITTVVPGDAITKNCTFTVTAVGDHLKATPTVPTTVAYTVTSTPAPTTLSLPVAATYTLGANNTAFDSTSAITASNNGQTLTAKIVVRMPFGSTTVNSNDTQALTAKLNTLTVQLTQVSTTSNPET